MVENSSIDPDTLFLHAVKNGCKGQVDVLIDFGNVASFGFRTKIGRQSLCCSSSSRQRTRRGLMVPRGNVRKRLRSVCRIERVGEQHGVIDVPLQVNLE